MDLTERLRKTGSRAERDAILERVLVDTRIDEKRAVSTLNALTDLLLELRAFQEDNRA